MDVNQEQLNDAVRNMNDAVAKLKPAAGTRSYAEIGSPEFAEDRTQINSLNNKDIFAREAARFDATYFHSLDHHGDVLARGLESLTESVNLQKKINQEYLTSHQNNRLALAETFGLRFKWSDMWAYNQGYDLANPVSTGVGDVVRGGAYTPNRAIDTASAGVGVSAEAVSAAVAKQVDATVTPVLLGLQQMLQSVAAATASIANVLAQTQPKAPAA